MFRATGFCCELSLSDAQGRVLGEAGIESIELLRHQLRGASVVMCNLGREFRQQGTGEYVEQPLA